MKYQIAKKWSLRQFITNSIINLEHLAQTDVGRCKSTSLCLRWVFLSSRHAAFVTNVYGNLLLRDLHSTSGTFVNGHALSSCENKLLAHGDIVSFGLAHYQDATTNHMKTCFFEVIADDRESTMDTSTSAQQSTSKTTKGKEKSVDSVESKDSFKNPPEGRTIGKGKTKAKTRQPITKSDPIPNKDKKPLVNPIRGLSSNPSNDSMSNTKGKEAAANPKIRTNLSIPPDPILGPGIQLAGECFGESLSDTEYIWVDELFTILDADLKNSQSPSPSNVAQASDELFYMNNIDEDFYNINKPSTSKMAQTSEASNYIDENFNDIHKPSTSKMTQASKAIILKKNNDKDFDDINKPSTSKMAQTSEASIYTKDIDDINKLSTSKMAQAKKNNHQDFDDINKPSTSKMAQASPSRAIILNKNNDKEFDDINKPSTSKMAQASEAIIPKKNSTEESDDINKPSTSKMAQSSKAIIPKKNSTEESDDINKPSTSKIAQASEAIIRKTNNNNNNKDFGDITNKPSTSKMAQTDDKTEEIVKKDTYKEEPSSKTPSIDECEHQNLCPSGIKRTILRKIPNKRRFVCRLKMEEAERERNKAILKKKLEELARQKKDVKLVPTEDAFDALLKAAHDKKKSDKGDDDDDDNDDDDDE